MLFDIELRCSRSSHWSKLAVESRFSTVWVSQAAAKQRAGRAGRTRPGLLIRSFLWMTDDIANISQVLSQRLSHNMIWYDMPVASRNSQTELQCARYLLAAVPARLLRKGVAQAHASLFKEISGNNLSVTKIGYVGIFWLFDYSNRLAWVTRPDQKLAKLPAAIVYNKSPENLLLQLAQLRRVKTYFHIILKQIIFCTLETQGIWHMLAPLAAWGYARCNALRWRIVNDL